MEDDSGLLQPDAKIEFLVTNQSEDFKKNVCIPYFKDIYKVNIFTINKFTFLVGP